MRRYGLGTRPVRRLGDTTPRRLLSLSMALPFTWIQVLWLPLHSAAETHQAALDGAPHSHSHSHSHFQGAPGEDETLHEGVGALMFSTDEHEHETSYAHQHPTSKMAAVGAPAPCASALLEASGFEGETPELATRSVPAASRDPPKLQDYAIASPRAPPTRGAPSPVRG